MELILGIIIIYTWVHAVIVFFKEPKKRTTYEKVVSAVALVAFALFVMGTV
jgi:hypothetical protein